MCACCVLSPPYSPQRERDSCGRFQLPVFGKVHPASSGRRRACVPGPPRVLGRQRGTRRGTSERVRGRAGSRTGARYRIPPPRGLRITQGINVSGLNIQLDTFYFEPTSTARLVVARARGARRATSPPQRRVHPTSGIRIAGTTAGRWARDDDARYDERRDTPFS